MQELNSHYQTHSRRTSASQPPLVVNRVKVTFQNEPGKVTFLLFYYTKTCTIPAFDNEITVLLCHS